MNLFFKKALRKTLNLLSANIVFNNIVIAIKLEKKIKNFTNPYLDNKIDDSKLSLLQIAGYSDRPEIMEVLEKNHFNLNKCVKENIKQGDKILDIGCGPGLYLKDFYENYKVTGTDISSEMIRISKKHLPNAKFVEGNFMEVKFTQTYDLIYCTGFLLYVPRTDIERFFEKVSSLLQSKGVFFLCFPHALRYLDTWYPNLGYIQYSPKFLMQVASKHFEVLDHFHNFDDRKIEIYDEKPYVSSNPLQDKTYRNSYVIIFKKK